MRTAAVAAPTHASALLRQVEGLIDGCAALEAEHAADVAALPPDRQESARNLLHYLAVRQHDLRDLQHDLAELGLSSLGRMEGHVLATLQAVARALRALSGLPADGDATAAAFPARTMRDAAARLNAHADELLGSAGDRHSRIMVTMPSEAATDPSVIAALVGAGMDVMRINAAHDDAAAWRAMVGHLRAAEAQLGRRCRVSLDLAGPKARTAAGGDVVRLHVGDRLVLTDHPAAAPADALRDPAGQVIRPATAGCTLPELVRDVEPGEPVWFDDGKIGGVVRGKSPGRLEIEVTSARGGSAKLRGDKGINVPQSHLRLSGLTPKDREDLAFAAEHADMVGLSFVRDADDVSELIDLLESRGADHLGVILKIETRRAFERLPRLLMRALRFPPVGVMVARGDLGVEVGFERLAEVQEEILWIAEAAHVPVIWATQVLDSLARKGLPSRAEVTDAAMSGRAECVMLNKGPMVVQAVKFLDDVLRRMSGHLDKKTPVLRVLHVSAGL